jgi:hypothetical protein
MNANTSEARLQQLEKKVERLQQLNQILLNHLLAAQSFTSATEGPTPANVNRWVIGLSNEVWNAFRYTPNL